MRETHAIYSEIEYLDKNNVTLVPVGEMRHGERYKVPFIKWRSVKEKIEILDLHTLLQKYDTDSVAIILGKISGNLICIDVDTKHKIGFDVTFIRDLEKFYPDIYSRFRKEKTPSGGYHFYYRIEGLGDTVVKSSNAASRYKTDDEITQEKKEKGEDKRISKTKCFLEIKAEGGLSQCYPSDGYELIDREIGVLTVDEHISIQLLCTSYSEIEPDAPYVKPTKQQNDFYSTNPFEDFDGSWDGEEVLSDAGWPVHSKNGKYIYYQKPDKKDKGVSAGFNTSRRLYTVWTAATDIEPKSYSPSNLLAEIMFDGDKKKLYAYLVAKGWGKIKPTIEKRIIESNAPKDLPLPSNISAEAKIEFEKIKLKLKETYPYGTFWDVNDNGVVNILRENLYQICHNLGFRQHQGDPVRLDGFLIKDMKENDFFDEIKNYISKDEDLDVFSAYESFIQKSGDFTISRLRPLEEDLILKSTKNISYKFFKNCYLRISVNDVEEFSYDKIQGLIWEKLIQKRDFKINKNWKDSIYYDFLDKATNVDSYVMKCIGYYAHDYRDEQGYFILTTEKAKDLKGGAGAGKNVFWSLFSLTTTYKYTAASMVKKDNQLLQSWNGERVFHLSDIPKSFDYIFFKDIITGGSVVRKLYKDEFNVPVQDMCKLGGSSNYSYDDSDPGIARRIRPIEFSDYFTKLGDGALKKQYGKMFPLDWSPEDYTGYDNTIVACIQEFLKEDCVIEKQVLSINGWIKQFEYKYSHLYEFFMENIDLWFANQRITNDQFVKYYHDFCKENSIKHPYSMIKINQALRDYCDQNSIKFDEKKSWRDTNTMLVRGKQFGDDSTIVEIKKPF